MQEADIETCAADFERQKVIEKLTTEELIDVITKRLNNIQNKVAELHRVIDGTE